MKAKPSMPDASVDDPPRACRHLDGRLAVAVEHETVRMRLAAKIQAAPFCFVCRDRDGGDLRIGVEVLLRQHLAELLGAEAVFSRAMTLDHVLDGVGRDRGGIVGVGIGARESRLRSSP